MRGPRSTIKNSQFRQSLRVGLTIGVLIAMLGLEGCAFSRGDLGAPLDASRVSDIKNGRTTEAQVIALLGAPDRIQEINKRQVFHYYRYAMKHGTVLVFSRVNIASDDLYVFFDQNGVVEQVVYGNRTNNLKFQFWPFGHTEGD